MTEPLRRGPGVVVCYHDMYEFTLQFTRGKHSKGLNFYLGEGIAKALTVGGWPCEALYPEDFIERRLNGPQIHSSPPAFVINFSMIPIPQECSIYDSKTRQKKGMYAFLADRGVLPIICYVHDHPTLFGSLFREFVNHPQVYFVQVESNEYPYLEKIGIPPARIGRMPTGGRAPNPKPKPFDKRKIGIIFLGSAFDLEDEATLRARLKNEGLHGPSPKVILEAVDEVVEQRESLDIATENALSRVGASSRMLGFSNFAKLVTEIDARSRKIRRNQFLASVAKLPVHVGGSFPKDFVKKHPKFTFHGLVPLERGLPMIADAKVTLDDAVNSRRTPGLRFLFALMEGSLAAVEPHLATIESGFDDRAGILSSFPYADMAEKIEAILEDPIRWTSMTETARAIYESKFLWKTAIEGLVPFLPPPGPVPAMAPTVGKATRSKQPKA